MFEGAQHDAAAHTELLNVVSCGCQSALLLGSVGGVWKHLCTVIFYLHKILEVLCDTAVCYVVVGKSHSSSAVEEVVS